MLLFSDNINFQNLKDLIEAAQLETKGTSFERQKASKKKQKKKETKSLSCPALSLSSGHFPVAGQVDVTLFINNWGAVQR